MNSRIAIFLFFIIAALAISATFANAEVIDDLEDAGLDSETANEVRNVIDEYFG